MVPYIDFHTHRKKSASSGLVSVYNLDYEEPEPENIYFSAGFHPWKIHDGINPGEIIKKIQSKAESDRCIAIGETGMDRSAQFSKFETLQEKIFMEQIKLSEALHKPLIIHCVRCFDKLIQFRKGTTQIWIVHGFSKSYELARQLIDYYNMIPSFGQLIFNPETKAYQTLQKLDINEFLLETDDSQISISKIYDQAARIKGISVEELKKSLLFRFEQIFQKSVFS